MWLVENFSGVPQKGDPVAFVMGKAAHWKLPLVSPVARAGDGVCPRNGWSTGPKGIIKASTLPEEVWEGQWYVTVCVKKLGDSRNGGSPFGFPLNLAHNTGTDSKSTDTDRHQDPSWAFHLNRLASFWFSGNITQKAYGDLCVGFSLKQPRKRLACLPCSPQTRTPHFFLFPSHNKYSAVSFL